MAATNQVTTQSLISRPTNHSGNSSPANPPSQIPNTGGRSPAPQSTPSNVRLCGASSSYDPYDYEQGYCDGTGRPCSIAVPGVSQYQAAQNLARNVAVRIHQNSNPTPSRPPQNSSSHSGIGEAILQGVLCLVTLGATCLTGCGPSEPNTAPEIPDGSNPPPGFDPECDGRRATIQSADPLAATRSSGSSVLEELNRQFPGITLPAIDMTYQGTPFLNDSQGNLISTVQTSDPVSFSRVGNHLYLLTANRVSGGYAPATLLVYDVSVTPPQPVATDSIVRTSTGGRSNAILLGYYNPVAMSSMVGNTELDILYGAPNAGVVSTVDPFSNRLVEGDWCSTHSAIGDGGMSHSDASRDAIDSSIPDSGRTDGASDADAGVDASTDSSHPDAAIDASADASRDAGVDGSRG